MKMFAGGERITIELWDGSVFPGLYLCEDNVGVLVERTAEHIDNTFVPWHSVKVLNHIKEGS